MSAPSISLALSQRRYSRSSATSQPRPFPGFSSRRDESSHSHSDASDDGPALGGVGSWTAGREDIRDGSARLASLSLLSPSPPLSASTSQLNLPSSSARPHTPHVAPASPSGLSRALLGAAPPIPLIVEPQDGAGSSPETDSTPTPTQSKPGSSPFQLKEAEMRAVEQRVAPPPARAGVEHRKGPEPVALGDETGGDEDSRDDSADDDFFEDEAVISNGVANETTPLLLSRGKVPVGKESGWKRMGEWAGEMGEKTLELRITPADIKQTAEAAFFSLPAVVLGVLMNILDGVSYGMIMFPTNLALFSDFGGIGVSMFFVSTLISQIVYSGGGSIFKGGNGSMMIEVVPFFHVIAGIISSSIGPDSTKSSIVATTMVAFALSSILTGLTFFALGALRLGSLSEFFPRHILVGCIGGVGAFLFITGLEVSARLDESAGLSSGMFRHLFDNEILPLWSIPLFLAILLRVVTMRYNHPLIFPGFFLAIPAVFWIIVLCVGIPLDSLRAAGWVFEVNGVDSEWYEYWTLFDFGKTSWTALIDTIPTQLALVFFSLLHVPINVPALAISIGEDNVDTNRELIAHGLSNVFSGLLGSCPNYLVYSNSVLFYRVGGTTRLSGFMLAAATAGILVAGPGVIGYLPVCVVSSLIFVLGIDLMKEAIWDTFGRVAQFEYITIWAIVLSMTVFDFVLGIGVGVLLACVSFVVSSSQRRAIRSILPGTIARSTVRRHPKQSAFLARAGSQTRVIKLQGFLFFGTISACEATIRGILEAASWSSDPIRFLVLDFSMASGVDFSAAEAFVRIQRLLEDKGVVLVLCGCAANSGVGIALRSVDLWAGGATGEAGGGVEVFENLNDALEHCENAFLRSLYSKDFGTPQIGVVAPGLMSQIDVPKSELESDGGSFEQSPRASHLRQAARQAMGLTESPPPKINLQQPLPLLLQSFRPFSPDMNEDFCFRLVPYLKRVHIERGTILWSTGDRSDCFYLIESGMLRANYRFLDNSHSISESMVAGTVAGDMTFLSRTKRNATVLAERDSVLWKMDISAHELMGEREGWSFCRRFEECLLRIACEEQEVLMGHLISSL